MALLSNAESVAKWFDADLILSARLLPPSGGDTLWASGIADYEALSEPLRRLLDPLQTEHDFLQSFPAWRFARA